MLTTFIQFNLATKSTPPTIDVSDIIKSGDGPRLFDLADRGKLALCFFEPGSVAVPVIAHVFETGTEGELGSLGLEFHSKLSCMASSFNPGNLYVEDPSPEPAAAPPSMFGRARVPTVKATKGGKGGDAQAAPREGPAPKPEGGLLFAVPWEAVKVGDDGGGVVDTDALGTTFPSLKGQFDGWLAMCRRSKEEEDRSPFFSQPSQETYLILSSSKGATFRPAGDPAPAVGTPPRSEAPDGRASPATGQGVSDEVNAALATACRTLALAADAMKPKARDQEVDLAPNASSEAKKALVLLGRGPNEDGADGRADLASQYAALSTKQRFVRAGQHVTGVAVTNMLKQSAIAINELTADRANGSYRTGKDEL